jgi:hypothetical protein
MRMPPYRLLQPDLCLVHRSGFDGENRVLLQKLIDPIMSWILVHYQTPVRPDASLSKTGPFEV